MKTLREQFEPQLARLARELAPLRAWFEARQPREQLIVAAGALVVALALVYLVLWQPFALARDHAAAALGSSRALAARIEQIGAQAQQSHAAGGQSVVGPEVSLLSAVDQASKDGILGKAPSRMQPDGDKQVRVWIEDVPFDAVLRWMDDLQKRYGVRVDGVTLERRPAAGTVNARLSLVRAQ
ncbi:MAG TPA: type II secretion system protein M [Nevskia sp.]|jgi:general secretion pathway protein M|nr:type II secretion system protein M [Nevskia sp.]